MLGMNSKTSTWAVFLWSRLHHPYLGTFGISRGENQARISLRNNNFKKHPHRNINGLEADPI